MNLRIAAELQNVIKHSDNEEAKKIAKKTLEFLLKKGIKKEPGVAAPDLKVTFGSLKNMLLFTLYPNVTAFKTRKICSILQNV